MVKSVNGLDNSDVITSADDDINDEHDSILHINVINYALKIGDTYIHEVLFVSYRTRREWFLCILK